MSASPTCFECGRALSMVSVDDVARTRESLGFGTANDRPREFCSIRCKALWLHQDRIILSTQQTRITAWRSAGLDRTADAIAYGR